MLFISPAVIFLLVFTIYPSAFGIGLSFTNYHFAFKAWKVIGLQNYLHFLQWEHLGQILRNTGIFVSTVVFFQITLGLLIALALNQEVKGRRVMRTIAILPWILPGFIIGLLFRQIFNASKFGLLNTLLDTTFGLPPHSWLTDPQLAMILLIFSLVWKGTALSIILQLSGLQTIPVELNEAARIDGARWGQVLFRITLPMLRNTLMINLIMASSGTFNHLDIPFTLTNGGPGRSTEVLALTLYKQGFEVLDAGFAATVGTVIFLLNIVLTIVYLNLKTGDVE